MCCAHLSERFLGPEPNMLPGRIEVTLKGKEGDHNIFHQPMVRSGKDEQAARSQKTSKFAKDKLSIINVLYDLGREDGIKTAIGVRRWLIGKDQLKLYVRKTFAIAFDDDLGNIRPVHLITDGLEELRTRAFPTSEIQ